MCDESSFHKQNNSRMGKPTPMCAHTGSLPWRSCLSGVAPHPLLSTRGSARKNTLGLNGSVSAEEVGTFPSFQLQDLLSVSLAEFLSGSPL